MRTKCEQLQDVGDRMTIVQYKISQEEDSF